MSAHILRCAAGMGMGLALLGSTPAPALAQNQPALVPSIRVSGMGVREGAAGVVVNLMFTVTVTSKSPNSVSVSFATANGSAKGGNCGTANVDYATKSGSLTFAPNQTSQTIAVQVCGDGVLEPNESFLVHLSGATNATIQTGTGYGMIIGDPPVLSIAATVTTAEAGTAVFTVTLLGEPHTFGARALFATAQGTASAGNSCFGSASARTTVDYITRTGTLQFSPGRQRRRSG